MRRLPALLLLVPALAAAQTTSAPSTAPRRAATSTAAPAVAYEVSFPNAAHHEAEIAATFAGLPARPVQLRMSRSSPGRYSLHEFAKNVYSVRAVDSRGRPLSVTQANPHQWDVAGHDGTVRVTYTLFGDRGDGTYAQIDRTHAHLNAPATFMWARGLDARPVRVTFRPLPGWRIATQLASTSDSLTFTAPGLQYLMDSPSELSAHEVHEWPLAVGGPEQRIRIALHHLGTRDEGAQLAEKSRRVTEEQAAVFGELPRFDYGTYTFLADYLPWASGDGMEHRNSTVVSSTSSLAQNERGLLGTISHEFFHIWNVERLRPRSLEPFDYTDANMSGELWLAEGFTNYYGSLTIRRAGLDTDAAFARGMGGAVNAVLTSPGRNFFSAVEMSQQAPFVDQATSLDPQNKANTFISYYTYGQAIGLALDLALRERGSTLDAFMQRMWATFGKPERPYTMDDVRRTLGAVAGDQAWADAFVRRHIAGREAPEYERLLARYGFLLRRANAGRAWIGDQAFEGVANGVRVVSNTLVGSPLYEAGIDRGDRIVSIDGAPVTAATSVTDILGAKRPGETITLSYESRGETREARVTLAEDPRLELVTFEDAGREPSEEMRRLRAEWLGSKARR